ncbi:6-phosphofructokinase [Candidatus Fermentibacteria bacterium]|nr:6-phosphofructokinase [Candidatus Fermentibacteria bacterium]
MERIAVLTSGGDSPGMNAAIRAAVRTGIDRGLSVFGVYRGFDGLIDGCLELLSSAGVSNIIQRGGTILHSARSPRFFDPAPREQAARTLADKGIEGLLVVGGDGSFRGANCLHQEHGVQVVGVPATIDNDIWGSDYTIGYDTAVNTALSAIDKIKDTAAAHDRLFLVEVMGRDAGFIALEVGVGSGAEEILIPETRTDLEALSGLIEGRREKGRTSSLVVVAEGDEEGNAYQIATKLEALSGLESHVTVLGHVQRGGAPTSADRVLATKLGWAAVEALIDGAAPCMVGEEDHEVTRHPLADSWTRKKSLDPLLVSLANPGRL